MKLTYYGHSTCHLEIGSTNIIFDPFIRGNEKASHIDISTIKADYILLSHGHNDHIMDAIPIANQNESTIITNFEIHSWYKNKFEYPKTHPLEQGGSWKFDFGKVKCVNAIHSSSLPDGSDGGNPVGFVLDTPEGNFYFAGDTALTMDMKLIPMFTKLDFAMLPIGDNFTMGIEEAVIAAQFIECKKIVGIHYDTFGYIEIDKEQARQSFADKGIELLLPAIGESITL